jgi:NTE family protein
MSKQYDTLVISGGSTKGFLFLGSLQYLKDKELIENITNLIGTSVGSIIAYLLCIGYTPIEILVFMSTHNILEKIQNVNMVSLIQGTGAVSYHHINDGIEKMTIDKIGFLPTLKDIQNSFGKNLIIVTYNITEDRTEYLNYENYPNIPCLTAIRMSSNIPLVFEHYRYGHSYYIDGGIADNFPIQKADQIGKKIIGINLGTNNKSINQDITEMDTMEYLYKLLFIPVNNSIQQQINNVSKNCDIINVTYEKSIKFFDFNIAPSIKMDMFSSGYAQAEKFFK